MCYFVCSDIAHFGNKGKQKKSISRRKTGKVCVFYEKCKCHRPASVLKWRRINGFEPLNME